MNEDIARGLVRGGNDLDDVIRNQQRLSRYFEQDEEGRFKMEGVVGAGTFGLTWKLNYTASSNPAPQESGPPPGSNPITSGSGPSVRRIVLKTDREYSGYDDRDDDRDDDPMDIDSRFDIEGDDYDDYNDDDDDDDEDELGGESTIPNEKWMLGLLRWAKHVVNGVEIPNDPLTREFPGIPSHRMKEDTWVYVEWIENGTISKLVDRAAARGIRLPNRVLWRFFLCLVRMCIAMGWPPEQPDGENPQPVIEEIDGSPYGGLIHRDLHEGNIMIGDLIPDDPDSEHTRKQFSEMFSLAWGNLKDNAPFQTKIMPDELAVVPKRSQSALKHQLLTSSVVVTPILRMIDLGSMKLVNDDEESNREAVHENIFDIGVVMLLFITLNHRLTSNIYPRESVARPFKVYDGRPQVMTNGTLLLNDGNNVTPFPWLDTGLRKLVCACLATDPENRPSPERLVSIVTNCVRYRDHQYYASRNYRGESDEEIRLLLSELVFNA